MASPDRTPKPAGVHGFRAIAGWQAASFVLLLLLVWVTELFELTEAGGSVPGWADDHFGAVLLSIFVLLTAVITIGQTYVKECRILSGFVTVCSYCHKVRIRKNAWEAIEGYLSDRCPVEFSHGLCPDCFSKEMDALKADDQD